MENILTDEMVQKAFEHMNNKADPVYGQYKEYQLGNPYINAGFAVAIEELYNIKMSGVPTLDEINDLRGKNELYVIHEQDYDLFWIDAVLSKDKLNEFTEEFAKNRLKDYQDPNKIKSIKKLENRENEVIWEIEFTDEYLQKVYEGYLRKNTLEDLKKNKNHVTYVGFNYDKIKINNYKL